MIEGRVCACGCDRPLIGRQLKWATAECSKKVVRTGLLMARFNMTDEQYDAILEVQGGKCPICLKRPAGKYFPVDHDHRTMLVRGIPCTFCNLQFIGRHADPEKFRRAAEYLENPPAQQVVGLHLANKRPRAKRRRRT